MNIKNTTGHNLIHFVLQNYCYQLLEIDDNVVCFLISHKFQLIDKKIITNLQYSKTYLKWPLKKKTKISFQDRLSLNTGQKYCRMPQGEHSAILSTFIQLPFVIKTFVLSIIEWPLKTGFTVHSNFWPI